jgi:PAS domain S-box-containing protein
LTASWLSKLKIAYTRWWRRLPPSRQDRLATIGPLISVLLFLTTITTTFWYLRNEEIGRETDSVQRDVEITQQQIALRLIENQEQLVRLAREIAQREIGRENFDSQSESLVDDRWEITQLSWVDAQRRVRRLERGSSTPGDPTPATAPASPWLPSVEPEPGHPSATVFEQARQTRRPQYSAPFNDVAGRPVFQLHVPLIERGAFAGALVAEYSIEALIWRLVPADVSRRHRISALGPDAAPLASTNPPMPGRERETASIVHDVPLTPALNGIVLRGEGWRTSIGLISNTLFWMVMALSVLTLWMLLGNWRHLRRRAQIQQALLKETQFRRAMENSMVTGMRALDMEGRITYVNAAFCQMIGYSESELLGCTPPYPYWPPDRVEENQRLLRQEMQGRSPAGGIEVRLVRKDGQMFDARMYVSPLVDLKGQQTGWMTSMTNITEAKRIRDQLSASHERFTTVLEGLDASVSVQSVQQGDLLFANRSYRLWFGADAQGHRLLTSTDESDNFDAERHGDVDPLSGLPMHELTEATGELREVYIEPLKKWFEVRSRYLQWTDGRLAQMVIATDVTARVKAEEVAKQQAEKVAVTSRLMTMGEMASTVAHELNQPLTAITNYCNGMVSRVTAGKIAGEDLLVALRKTAHQAERAGKIIHRIRAFVKRSEPQRQAVNARTVVDNAVELAGIELRRRHVAIRTYVAQRLPVLKVDPILIEQVLLNLMKNAAEAIDLADLPSSRRHLELRVVPRYTPEDGGGIEFSVTDAGPGLPEEVLHRLYEAFYSTKADGMGIGLSLCRSIVESHHGRMRAQNLYNGSQVVGCRFSFTLPVELPSHAEAPTAPAPVEMPSTPRETAPEPATLP